MLSADFFRNYNFFFGKKKVSPPFFEPPFFGVTLSVALPQGRFAVYLFCRQFIFSTFFPVYYRKTTGIWGRTMEKL